MRVRRSRRPVRLTAIALVLGIAATLAGCRPAAPADALDLAWTLEPSTPAVGSSTLTLRLRDAAGGMLPGARVRVEGHMTHPGMRPVLATAAERAPGVYHVPFSFTMAGDWVLVIVAILPDGRRVERRIDVPNVAPGG